MDNKYTLHLADYFVFGLMMLVTVAIGVLFAMTGGRQRTTDEYFTANGQLGVIPASLSIVVSYMSAIMIVGVPAESYLYGGQYLLAALGMALGTAFATFFVVPIFYPLKLVSINSYLEMRYNSKYPKLFGTFQSVLIAIIYTAMVLYAPCSAISLLLGVPVWTVILASSMIAIFYTTIGGIKAVVWSDAFLCICMLSGMVAIVIQGVLHAGGPVNAWEVVANGQRLNMFDWRIDPTIRLTFWGLVLGGAVDSCGTYSFVQSSLQRYGNVKSLRKAQITVFLTIFGNLFMVGLPVLAGLSIFAYYQSEGCDPISGGIVSGPNQLVPHFVMETLNYPGIPGLFVASITAGALSSVSSALNSAAANTYDDLMKPHFPAIKQYRATVFSKILVVVYGCIATGLCFIVMLFGGTVYQLSYAIVGMMAIPWYSMFYSGIMCPWMNGKGLLVGGICGYFFIFFICMGQYFTETFSRSILPTTTENCVDYDHLYNASTVSSSDIEHITSVWSNETTGASNDTHSERTGLEWLFSISYLWYRTIGITITIVVGSLVSLVTGRRKLADVEGRFLCCCYKKCAAEDEDEEVLEIMLPKMRASWTQDEFYSVHRKNCKATTNSSL